MKVLITGATGLVGKEIVKQCHEQGIVVNYLSTSKAKLKTESNYKGFYWNPETFDIDINCFRNVDAIINLAGATISKRWTTAYKQQIINSRVGSLQFLCDTMRVQQIKIPFLVSASAIGYYPDSETNYYDETFSNSSNTFLGEVVKQWETAANAFSEIEMRTYG